MVWLLLIISGARAPFRFNESGPMGGSGIGLTGCGFHMLFIHEKIVMQQSSLWWFSVQCLLICYCFPLNFDLFCYWFSVLRLLAWRVRSRFSGHVTSRVGRNFRAGFRGILLCCAAVAVEHLPCAPQWWKKVGLIQLYSYKKILFTGWHFLILNEKFQFFN